MQSQVGIAAGLHHMQSPDSGAEGAGYYFFNVSLASEREEGYQKWEPKDEWLYVSGLTSSGGKKIVGFGFFLIFHADK